MSRSQRMQPILKLAVEREDEAARVLGFAQQAVQNQERQLEELRQYRLEYIAQAQQAGERGISASRFMELQRFIASLDGIIEQQKRRVELAREEAARKLQSWQEARGKHKAMEKVIERMRTEEEQAASRREQKETDEFAQRKPRGGY